MLDVRIGNYRLVEKIGEGGMGVVYRAVHETLGRSVAIKVLLPYASDAPSGRDLVARLFNEARLATAIRHPGVVDIHDVGVLPDRTAYIVMELLEGETLAARLRRGGDIPYARALQIARAVARTLHAAHEHGVVHRDLKPDNIFLVPDPETSSGERIKLLDFGIAKPEADRAELALTQTGMMVGTPPYMSPEQCRAVSVDRRTDLYALGCVLYELACGRPPFISGSAADIIAHHLYFSPATPRRHGEPVPPPIAALILWLLQKDPRHRPATAAQVVAAIDQIDLATLAAAPDSTTRTTVAMESMPTLTSPATGIHERIDTVERVAIGAPPKRDDVDEPAAADADPRWGCDYWNRTGRRACRRSGA
jgi:eukaryotic-like serine/threonine-protein kinase